MKLILANNQSPRFKAFYKELQERSDIPFGYAGYESLLFIFDTESDKPVSVYIHGKGELSMYDGVYLNGYLHTYELAATTAICCQALTIPFVNHELASPPSLSKLSGYAKLAAAGVPVPKTIAGSKAALLQAGEHIEKLRFPLVLKRADADRGIDNFKIESAAQITELLRDHDSRSLWIAQEFVENNGFYLVSFYGQQPKFCIFRTLEARPDGDSLKAHMYKPHGGTNAHLIPLDEAPALVIKTCQEAMEAMDRQIGSVDCLFDETTGNTWVLEVNYNPQLVTIETFKEVRIQAFLSGLGSIE